MKIKFWTFLIFFLGISFVLPAYAATTPNFPLCVNPQGSLKVNYSQGTHGIVGSNATYTGNDTVYTLSDSTLVQCFCADDGNGIQTNWWNASNLSGSDIQILKNQGWYYIPNGSLWGLDETAYIAYNSNYTCRGGIGGGKILTAATDSNILGLASTGNSMLLIYTGVSGIGSFLLGIYLLKTKRK